MKIYQNLSLENDATLAKQKPELVPPTGIELLGRFDNRPALWQPLATRKRSESKKGILAISFIKYG